MTDLPSRSSGAWGVLLAGGDGSRLRPLTTCIEGDERPKQFCRILGERSLFGESLRRIAPLFDLQRTIAVVTRKHEKYYSNELGGLPGSSVLVQPCNRGTGVAIASTILMLRGLDDDAVVAFFPCDHYYGNEAAFLRAVEAGLRAAGDNPDKLVLLGAAPTHLETEYGWIEPELLPSPPAELVPMRVRRFWEKPTLATTHRLLRIGCLWNTFVTMGRVSAFIEALCAAVPKTILALSAETMESDLLPSYRSVGPIDFSRDVLSTQSDRLLVIRDEVSRWTDLGRPSRVLETIACEGLTPNWLRLIGAAPLPRAS